MHDKNTYPKLSKSQLKRLRTILIHYKMAKTPSKARDMTSNNIKCKKIAIELFTYYGVPKLIEDIADLYVVEEDPIKEEKPTKKIKIKKGRGPGKKPKKVMYPVRFEAHQLSSLKDLGGNVSSHIREAVNRYIVYKTE